MREKFGQFLLWTKIAQEHDNENSKIKKGRGYPKARRLNPFNPFAYLFALGYELL